jgi:hypothetical protein
MVAEIRQTEAGGTGIAKDRPINNFPLFFPLTLPSSARGEGLRKSHLSAGPKLP